MRFSFRWLVLPVCATLTSAAWAGPVRVQVQTAKATAADQAVLILEPVGHKVEVKPVQGTEIIQRDKAFVPEVTVVPVGSSVVFPNQDTVRHHVYSFSEAKRFELKLYIGRPANPVVFDKPGLVILGCNIHDHMVGWVVVSASPWYAKTGPNGLANWADVPAGAYRLRTWHPDLPVGSPGIEQPVQVTAGALSLTVKLPVQP